MRQKVIYTNGKVAALSTKVINPDLYYENVFKCRITWANEKRSETKIDKILSFADIGNDINNRKNLLEWDGCETSIFSNCEC